MLSGTAETGAEVTIYRDGTTLDTVTADGSGSWTFTDIGAAGTSGTYTAEAVDLAGNSAVTDEGYAYSPSTGNTDPVAGDDSANTDEDTAVVISVLDNDSDSDGDTLSISGVSWTFGAHAFKGEDPNGTWTVRLTEKDVTFDVDNYGSDGVNKLYGMRGNDTLSGLGGDDVLAGGQGDDQYWGGAGDDLFEFHAGDGADWIWDLVAGAASDDQIALYGTGFMTFADLDDIFADSGGNAVIDFGNGDSITFAGLSSTELHEDDFLFYA